MKAGSVMSVNVSRLGSMARVTAGAALIAALVCAGAAPAQASIGDGAPAGSSRSVADVSVTDADETVDVSRLIRKAGWGQSAKVGQAFAERVEVTAVGADGRAVAGAMVAFAITGGEPGFDATGTFDNGDARVYVRTDTNGHALSPRIKAGTTAGQMLITAHVDNVSTNGQFTVHN